MPEQTFVDITINHIRAGYQILMVPTSEESRCEQEIAEAAKRLGYKMICWDQIAGFVGGEPIVNPVEALLKVLQKDFFPERHVIVVFKDLHNFYSSAELRRMLRSLSERVALNTKEQHRPVIILQPSTALHPDLASCVTTLDFSLPTSKQLRAMVTQTNARIEDTTRRTKSEDLLYAISQSLRGLTSSEAVNCLHLCVIQHAGFNPGVVSTIEATKANMLKRSQILTYTPREKLRPVSEIGGYDDLIAWVQQRALAYTPDAAEVDLDLPKGIVLIGVPGVGKSAVCECIASVLGLSLINFDFSAVFASHVGESEQRTRDVINMVKSQEGCVLVIDEADKSMGGTLGSTGDNGVSRRVLGQLLTWLASKDDRTFVVMTMNRTAGMPPELLRKGRLDQIWYVDMPTEEERRAIFSIHMKKRHIDPGTYSESEWKQLVKKSSDLVGSEIEEAIKAARFTSYQADKGKRAVPTFKQLLEALAEVWLTRVTLVDKESIKEIRDFGKTKAKPVSSSGRSSSEGPVRNLDLKLPGSSGENN